MTVKVGYVKPPSYMPWALLGFIIGGGVFALWYFHVEPAYTYLAPIVTQLTVGAKTLITPFANVWAQICTGFMENPIPYVMGLISFSGVVYGLISKIRSDRLKQQAEEAAMTQAINYENKLYEQTSALKDQATVITALEGKVADYEANNPADLLSKYEIIITEQNEKMANLRGQIQALSDKLDEYKIKVKETTVVK